MKPPTYPPLRAVIFDLDGTLVDSAPDLACAANRMLAALGEAARIVIASRAVLPAALSGAVRA